MIAPTCKHKSRTSKGKDRKGQQRWKCKDCGVSWTDYAPKPLGDMQVNVDKAKLALRMLVEGMSIRAASRLTGLKADTICDLVVVAGESCDAFLKKAVKGVHASNIELDERGAPGHATPSSCSTTFCVRSAPRRGASAAPRK